MTQSSPQPSTADAVIDALGEGGDELTEIAEGFSQSQLRSETRPGQWTRAAVLSHLGSGAVIALAGLEAALAGRPNPGYEANAPIWEQWNAMGPMEQREGFIEANATLQARYDALDAATRADLRVDLGFLPEPVDLATAALFRLNELSLHSWDLRSVNDAEAQVHEAAVPLIIDGLLPMMGGWLGKGEQLDGRTASLAVALSDPEGDLGLELSPERVTLAQTPAEPDGVLTMPAEAFLRLVTGRLYPERTPPGVGVMGPVDLDTLRRVFPGF